MATAALTSGTLDGPKDVFGRGMNPINDVRITVLPSLVNTRSQVKLSSFMQIYKLPANTEEHEVSQAATTHIASSHTH